MIKYEINPNYSEYEPAFMLIEALFDQSSNVIHEKRNVIKNIELGGLTLNVKSFAIPNIINKIVYTFFRESKAKRSYEYSTKIAQFVPEPLGFVELYKHGLLDRSFFISQEFKYDFTIREILFDEVDEKKRAILEGFARFSFALHEMGIEHLDYSPGNILIKKEKDSYTFKIVDINRMKFGEMDLDKRAKNFAKVWLRDEDMKIIIETYTQLAPYTYKEMLPLALEYSQKHKERANMKKSLKEKVR